MSKVLNVFKKIVLGIFLFYLIAGFILIPLVLTFVIPSQGSKILKTPVKLRSVLFNPFLLQLNINGLQVLDHNNQVLAGFDKLYVDVSYINLFKGIYRVEKIQLDALEVNPVLLSNGHINLLDLIPAAPALENKVENKGQAPASPDSKMPLVIVDQIILHKGKVHFQDQSITPHFSTTLNEMELKVEGLTTRPDDVTKINFSSKLDEKGLIATEAMVKPMGKPLSLDTNFTLNGYALQILTPYVGKYTGRVLQNGVLDIKMDYRISDNKLTASHKLLIQHFEFGQKVESKDALPLPFGLAVGLLEDSQGKINISLPVSGDMSSPQFHYWGLVGQVVRNFFMKLVTKPFSFLGSLVGLSDESTEELGYVRFTPGQMEISQAEEIKLKTLVEGLKQRPLLTLEVNGSYDPKIDWKAIMTESFNKDYADLRKKSSKADTVVYQQLYQRHFGIRSLWNLAKKYKKSMGKYSEEEFNKEMKRQLIENAPADKGALDVLAQARAQKVYNEMVALGLDSKRLKIGTSHEAQSSMGYVPMEFTLTVPD